MKSLLVSKVIKLPNAAKGKEQIKNFFKGQEAFRDIFEMADELPRAESLNDKEEPLDREETEIPNEDSVTTTEDANLGDLGTA